MNRTYAKCVAYSFEQCLGSDIEVLGPIESDYEKLQQLKDLAAAYEKVAEGETFKEDEWQLSRELIECVKSARSLSDIKMW